MSTVVYAMGRFNPPHDGHGFLLDMVRHFSKVYDADTSVWVSAKCGTKDPLPQDIKISILRKLYGSNVNLYPFDENFPTYFEQLELLSRRYNNLVFVTGSDHLKEYKLKMRKYNGSLFKFDKIDVVSCGERAGSISGTIMRQAALDGDIKTFSSGVKCLSKYDAQEYMTLVRKYMGLSTDEKVSRHYIIAK